MLPWGPQTNHSQVIDHYTPPGIFDAISLVFDLDPASPEAGPVTPARRHYTIRDNGLVQPWVGHVWLNPPYDRASIGKWMERMNDHADGIALVFARTDTTWFQALTPDLYLFIRGRLRFGGATVNAPAPSVLMSWGPEPTAALDASAIAGFRTYPRQPSMPEPEES